MASREHRTVFISVFAVVIILGGYWAVYPFLHTPAGLHPTGWSYAQLIRDRYPVHLIAPEWLRCDFTWSFYETLARLAVVAIFAACGLIIAWKTREKKTSQSQREQQGRSDGNFHLFVCRTICKSIATDENVAFTAKAAFNIRSIFERIVRRPRCRTFSRRHTTTQKRQKSDEQQWFDDNHQ